MNETRPANPKRITLYALQTCPHCRRLKEYLKEHGVEHELVLVDLLTGDERSAVLAAVKRINPASSFPTLVIDDQVIVGYKPEEVEKILHKFGAVSH
ncbi:glutaredoxin family protein [Desulfosoma caldarium]|uniref:Glutaredoxin n=1 Tax=Desulfosoma caldarium TaxID=610254 RepID=A0A3N1UQN2_9BACT|nr:glutaredoxin family protein [Desulfosoma caldarium]ROQ93422.1 glutaredoxin [Desulfosoma caldarium]